MLHQEWDQEQSWSGGPGGRALPSQPQVWRGRITPGQKRSRVRGRHRQGRCTVSAHKASAGGAGLPHRTGRAWLCLLHQIGVLRGRILPPLSDLELVEVSTSSDLDTSLQRSSGPVLSSPQSSWASSVAHGGLHRDGCWPRSGISPGIWRWLCGPPHQALSLQDSGER